MPDSYKVVKAAFKKQVPAKSGSGFFHVYTYLLDPLDGGQAKDAEEFVHSSEPMLKEGEHVEGTVTPDTYGNKFKRVKTGAPPPSTGTPSSSGSRESFRKHPAEVAGARYSAAQDKALKEGQIRAFLDREAFGPVFSRQWIKEATDWYAEEAKKASENA